MISKDWAAFKAHLDASLEPKALRDTLELRVTQVGLRHIALITFELLFLIFFFVLNHFPDVRPLLSQKRSFSKQTRLLLGTQACRFSDVCHFVPTSIRFSNEPSLMGQNNLAQQKAATAHFPPHLESILLLTLSHLPISYTLHHLN